MVFPYTEEQFREKVASAAAFYWEKRLQQAVALADSPLPPLPEFQGTSYLRRYEILCERLVLERDYTATALLVSDSRTASVRDGGESVGAQKFFKPLYSYLSARS